MKNLVRCLGQQVAGGLVSCFLMPCEVSLACALEGEGNSKVCLALIFALAFQGFLTSSLSVSSLGMTESSPGFYLFSIHEDVCLYMHVQY